MEHFYLLLVLPYTEYHAIDMGFVSIKQVPEFFVLRCPGASIWLLRQTKNSFVEPAVPSQRGLGIFDVDFVV